MLNERQKKFLAAHVELLYDLLVVNDPELLNSTCACCDEKRSIAMAVNQLQKNEFGCDVLTGNGLTGNIACPKTATKRFWFSKERNAVNYQDACDDHLFVFQKLAQAVQDLSVPTADIRPPEEK